jgi:hypothetical protein
MMRNLIVVSCAGLLALGLSVSSFAGSETDTDLDGFVDTSDNCVVVPNGPLLGTGLCTTQLDGDMDGYGNPCDTDVDQDDQTTLADVTSTLSAAGVASTDPIFDFDCDGQATLGDVTTALADAGVAAVPGPSGLACAGTIPCP